MTGHGLDPDAGRAARGIPATSTIAVDHAGVFFLARTARRYTGGEVEDLYPGYRVPAGGARLAPDSEAHYFCSILGRGRYDLRHSLLLVVLVLSVHKMERRGDLAGKTARLRSVAVTSPRILCAFSDQRGTGERGGRPGSPL